MPNISETVEAFLGTVGIGSIWSSCSPDFGINGVIERFSQIKMSQAFDIQELGQFHHHYQKLGYAEPKIVARFWIVGIMLAIFTIITFKLR